MHVDEENQSSKFGEASFAFGHALVARLGSGGLDEAQHGTVQHRSVGELFVVSEPCQTVVFGWMPEVPDLISQ
jgi:hypothetical protein